MKKRGSKKNLSIKQKTLLEYAVKFAVYTNDVRKKPLAKIKSRNYRVNGIGNKKAYVHKVRDGKINRVYVTATFRDYEKVRKFVRKFEERYIGRKTTKDVTFNVQVFKGKSKVKRSGFVILEKGSVASTVKRSKNVNNKMSFNKRLNEMERVFTEVYFAVAESDFSPTWKRKKGNGSKRRIKKQVSGKHGR